MQWWILAAEKSNILGSCSVKEARKRGYSMVAVESEESLHAGAMGWGKRAHARTMKSAKEFRVVAGT